MVVEELFDTIEEALLDILARIDDGDENALQDLKKIKVYIKDLNDVLSIIEDKDTIKDFEKKLDILSKKFDEFLMDIVRVTG
ncbi:hypothetical protein [Candidatus Aciduliprofundum boonei]|uniref:Uncharacterized protein n=1 Tax=Aciduliprofundum boonei (strain DSM 19572 / T469) TaxID=439481 RepID=D3T9J0_ACIB4|nr:hypothetical protein [Candidatus Aciduliprofundum boonei]ADD08769.1 conserved hypothetical protein [Aciduliprofundum boonei T469]HII55667.1 hypothetical protein [Candidatus Aciduliprofundum boonei]